MAKNETKPAPINIANREQADAALAEMYRLDQIIAEHEKAESEEKAQREAVELLFARQEKAVVAWAQKDRKNWTAKTLTLINGTISFTTSPGKVGLIKKIAKSFDAAVELLRASRKELAKKFLRPRPDDLNKELLLQEFEDGRIKNEQLEEFGLRVEKPEVCLIKIAPGCMD